MNIIQASAYNLSYHRGSFVTK